ncbi:TetR family transcriptional regulator [Tetragenococcus halophilus subsp. flandriensis]|uniref:TetR/AcrR family transcriptional regulator n=1 Tax=Tetragenococcus halophilus TaxID=51669 RepID=UPI0023E95E89|nr:TetR/AcrR family transcriptional regulator [Tetragenococcus halophilus]GMA07198.1 TetR family transcriptional regulator [Tetragenococcus halophilus subsp. flandriensis]
MARPKGQGQKTKELIAEKAKKIFEQKGYVGTSMEDIRKYSQISKGSIYYHFKNKEELFLYTVRTTSEKWQTSWEEHAEKVDSATEKLYLLAKYYAFDMQNVLAYTVPEYIATENIDKIMSNQIFELIKPEFEVFYQILSEGIRQKEFKSNQSPNDLAYILYSTLTGLSITQFMGYNEKQFFALYQSTIDVFLKGIATKTD